MFFWFLLSETNDGYDDVETSVGSFNKTPEKLERKAKNPISLFFRFLGAKIREIFSTKNKEETIKEALIYPEDEMKADDR